MDNFGTRKTDGKVVAMDCFLKVLSRKYLAKSLSEFEGLFELITWYTLLFYQVLCEEVWWDMKVDQALLFRKIKGSIVNVRANLKKDE